MCLGILKSIVWVSAVPLMPFRCRTQDLHESREFIVISPWTTSHLNDTPYTNTLLRFSSASPLIRTVPFGLIVASETPTS
ncbi:hypothetical protein BKA82DRAFT_714408 [Pisolithus tinctorius]|uniref:Uncharacterized protein n=1 Tax=Pisolithus tinctorius Marx 270 TaxID=870435 RepID=A0A0C3P3X5_PISTI|nr:hypothetical protein BKA82DRAFT_714408 [Pisolithus tinctorius]KIO02171.1 hypothetical protein M404DRAFT_714408 [Pisolithus tinctorius Marx 270]